MKIISLTSVGEHLSHAFGQEPSDAMKIIWFLRRHGNSASDDSLKEYVVSGTAYAVAMTKLRRAGAVTEG